MSSPEARIVNPLVPEFAAEPATATAPTSRSCELTACARTVVFAVKKKKPARAKAKSFIRFLDTAKMVRIPPPRPDTLYSNLHGAIGEPTPVRGLNDTLN